MNNNTSYLTGVSKTQTSIRRQQTADLENTDLENIDVEKADLEKAEIENRLPVDGLMPENANTYILILLIEKLRPFILDGKKKIQKSSKL